jgi:hypothetical protein
MDARSTVGRRHELSGEPSSVGRRATTRPASSAQWGNGFRRERSVQSGKRLVRPQRCACWLRFLAAAPDLDDQKRPGVPGTGGAAGFGGCGGTSPGGGAATQVGATQTGCAEETLRGRGSRTDRGLGRGAGPSRNERDRRKKLEVCIMGYSGCAIVHTPRHGRSGTDPNQQICVQLQWVHGPANACDKAAPAGTRRCAWRQEWVRQPGVRRAAFENSIYQGAGQGSLRSWPAVRSA